MADNGLTNDHASNDNLMVLMDEELDQDDEFDLEYYLAAADQAPLTSETMAAVVSDDGPTAADELAALSNLPTALRSEFAARWARLALARRRELINALGRLEDVEVVYTFGPIFYVALDDPDPAVRWEAIQGLSHDTSQEVLEKLLPLARKPDPEVQPAAVEALASYAYQSSVGSLDGAAAERLTETLHRLVQHEPFGSRVQLRAIESLAYLPDDPVADEYTERLYNEGGEEEQVAALIAMARSLSPRWEAVVLDELDSESPRMRFHAAAAAGEMELADAIERLGVVAAQDDDGEVRLAAIWALGEIEDPLSTHILNRLLDTDDEETREAVEEALSHSHYWGAPIMKSATGEREAPE